MLLSTRSSLVFLMVGVVAGAFAGCSSDSGGRTPTSFGDPAGSGAAAGASGGGGFSGGGAAAGSIGQGGFVITGAGGHAGKSGAGGAAANGAGNSGGSTLDKYPDAAAGSGAWGAWTGIDASACVGAGCGTGGLSGDGEAPTCAGEAKTSEAITMDVLIVFDNSSSMSCDVADQTCTNGTSTTGNTRIGAIRNAINGFVSSPASADLRVGLECFPPANPLASSQCTWDYSTADIPIARAGDNVTTFATVLGGLTPHLNTPTEQALTGAYAYSKAYMAANAGHSVAVVLVTDGMPFACNNDQTGAVSAALAQAAFAGSPSIQTYVVGLGNTATLDAIALAGTGGATHYIAANADATTKIQALLKMVTSTITCDYTLPTGGTVLDYGEVNVRTRVGDAGFVDLYKVDNAAACGAKGGWFYDVNPNPPAVKPGKITLCPQSCDPLKAAQSSSLQVVIGCATMTIH